MGIRDWREARQPKRYVKPLVAAIANVVNEAEMEERDLLPQHFPGVAAARAILHVGEAVLFPPSSDRWPLELCRAVIASTSAAEDGRQERTWQQEEMLRLIME
jgi:hypothetical protein